jgi:hypothetical protein
MLPATLATVMMLQLRFACKTATADEGTLQGRAFAQCRERLRSDVYALSHPAYAHKQTERTRSWAQSVAVAARRFTLPVREWSSQLVDMAVMD